MGLLDTDRRSEIERLFEKVEDGTLVPEIGRHGYVVSLAGPEGFPSTHRGVRIDVLTAGDLGEVGFSARSSTGEPELPDAARQRVATPTPYDDSEDASLQQSTPPRTPTPPEPTSPAGGTPSAPRTPTAPSAGTPRPVPPVVGTPGRGPAAPESPSRQSGESPGLCGPHGGVESTVPLRPVPPSGGRAESASTRPEGNGHSPGPNGAAPAAFPELVDVHLGDDAHAGAARWRISTAGSPHLFVLGIPGQGKSVTTRRILNSFASQGLPSLVLDFHGDMAAEPPGRSAVLDATEGLPFSPFELRGNDHTRYQQAAWELSEVIGYVCGLGEIQRNAAYEGLREVYKSRGFGSAAGPDRLPTMEELSEAVAAVESAGRGRNVVARMRPLSDFGLLTDDAEHTFTDLLQRGVVLDVHGLMEQVQVAAGAFVLRKVYREMFQWGQSKQLRLAVVLDEAHRLAKDVTLPKIMKEGRKYGVAVVVASQGVADFHKDVLANAGTKVAFRCNFPESRTVAGFMRGRAGQDLAVALENLSVGQAYVSTPDRAEARKVFMAKD
ncbi:ATP-binding protein [Pseudonocardia sp. Ae707_Ps1]|uniref:ATP-binding protein n=2 Tax=unclassified Pseudonocardia TaxID=2619320 RepID=UPI002015F4C7|nr:ATP-binding protein [Pseudonocardia sp. Ae707_Ps1]